MTKIGIFGIGLDTYWDQFEGLLDRLKGYQKQIAGKMLEFGVEVVDAGLDRPLDVRPTLVLTQRPGVSPAVADAVAHAAQADR